MKSQLSNLWLLLTMGVLLALGLYLNMRKGAPDDFETQVNECRHRCVALNAEAWQYGRGIGCVCVGQLP